MGVVWLALCVDVSVLGDVPVDAAREAARPNDANPPVRSPELPDNVHRDFHGVVVRGLQESFPGKGMLAASS